MTTTKHNPENKECRRLYDGIDCFIECTCPVPNETNYVDARTQEEREAIIAGFNELFINDHTIPTYIAEGRKVEEYLRQAILSHEEKVVARVIDELRKRLLPKSWDETTPCSKMLSEIDNALTLPITDEV